MLTLDNIKEAIKLAELDVDLTKLTENSSLSELGLDSLDIFNFLLELEEITGKKVEDEDIEKLISIPKILEFYNS